ncbi:MAG: aminotransferase class I/II-fold pyridoxal phosphate-dependent enzyme [Bacteroidia bacterium]|nr:aminotransferase class I/II-fold pyridoxal phosphate-dependent enzyme [Bacteroidia bacterium]
MILLNSGIGNYVISNGKRFSYFGGNNYLGLAGHPLLKEAAIRAIEKYGVNFSASRRTSGTSDIHIELEEKLADFKGKQNSVVFASGYQGNSILLEVLRDKYSEIFLDQNAHSSILSAVKSGSARIHYYNHCDAGHLGSLMKEFSGPSPLIITDGVFALTGEIAPLDKIYPLVKKHKAILVVDDAHATGVLGKNGRGTPEYFGLPDNENIFQSETMSKALGSYGGFISGNRIFTDFLRETSATYQASTSLPPSVVAAGIAALAIIKDNPELRIKLIAKADELRSRITGLDFQTTTDSTPIIPVILNTIEKAKHFSLYLEEHGIIVPFMDYPSSRDSYMIRIAVSVSHTGDQIDELFDFMKKWRSSN